MGYRFQSTRQILGESSPYTYGVALTDADSYILFPWCRPGLHGLKSRNENALGIVPCHTLHVCRSAEHHNSRRLGFDILQPKHLQKYSARGKMDVDIGSYIFVLRYRYTKQHGLVPEASTRSMQYLPIVRWRPSFPTPIWAMARASPNSSTPTLPPPK